MVLVALAGARLGALSLQQLLSPRDAVAAAARWGGRPGPLVGSGCSVSLGCNGPKVASPLEGSLARS